MPPANMKVIIIGESGVGKSSLMARFVNDSFTEDMQSTIGCDMRQKKLALSSGESVTAALWDTAGQEAFRSVSSSLYRNTHAALFVYDVTSKSTFDAIPTWLAEARNHVPDLTMMLVANKIDLIAEDGGDSGDVKAAAWREQEKSAAEQFAQENQMLYVRTSAKTREGVAHAFEAVVERAAQSPAFRALLEGGGAAPRRGVDLAANKSAVSGDGSENNAAGGMGCGCF